MNALTPMADFETDWLATLPAPHQCKFPLGDPKQPGFRFCAAPRMSGESYCCDHLQIVSPVQYAKRQSDGVRVARSYVDEIYIARERKPHSPSTALLKRRVRQEPVVAAYTPRKPSIPPTPVVRLRKEPSKKRSFIITEIDGFKPVFPEPTYKGVTRYDWPLIIPNESQVAAMALAAMCPPKISVPAIIRAVSDVYDVPVKELIGKRRSVSIVLPRQIAMWLVREIRPDRSLPEIGRRFGGRDHTTVLHAVRKINNMIADGAFTIPEPLLALTKPVGGEG